jgi:D-glycero-alpha-D-manno-heptose-7-phosphate kinase
MSSAGIGLASSSALAVGVLNSLHAYKGEFVTVDQLAREACYIEIECLGQNNFLVECWKINSPDYGD